MPPCPGCGLVRGPAEGPTHPYIIASPGCWARFGELLAAGLAAPGSGQLVTDTYAVQHPGVPERRAVQSVAVHLVSLCASLERGWPPERAPHLLRRALARPAGWRWLNPALPLGRITVSDVAESPSPDERGRRARAWAQDLWSAYSMHHSEIRQWLDHALQ